ncbi:MAG: rhodanese-like domain-containing protein [Armatimonadota bacterium]
MKTIKTCSVDELRDTLKGGSSATLIDVREYPEYTESHIDGAKFIPLGTLRQNPHLAGEMGEVSLLCRSGRRAAEAAHILSEQGKVKPVVVTGGIEAWKKEGHPVKSQKGPIALERQVRIAAGALVLTGLLVPGLHFLPYVVGAGLIFAGISNTCAMGMLLARLPWNQTKVGNSAACPVGQ